MKATITKRVFFTAIIILCIIFNLSLSVNASEPPPVENTYRLAGDTRYSTAVKISQEGWPLGSESVILTNGTQFPDALSGVPLAYLKDAPILLTPGNSLALETKEEIERLQAKTIYILGGTSAVSQTVEDNLIELGYQTQRIFGLDRFETAIAVGEEVRKSNSVNTVVLATGYNYPDALSIAPFAALNHLPILFTENKSFTPSTKNTIINWGVENVIIVGGDSAVSEGIQNELTSLGLNIERIQGIDRYETSLEIAKRFDEGNYQGIIAATGENFADALTGSVLAAKSNMPIILVKKDKLDSNTAQYMDQLSGTPIILGGDNSVSDTVVEEVVRRILRKFEISYSSYTNTFSEALSIQMQHDPQTDLYSIDWQTAGEEDVAFYLNPNNFVVEHTPDQPKQYKIIINTPILRVRSGPSTTNNQIGQVYIGQTYEYLDFKDGWYQINYNNTTGWVHGDYVIQYVQGDLNQDIPVQMFQFLVLSGTSGVTTTDLNNILNEKGILHNSGQAFIDAGLQNNINEIYLVTHALLETGAGTSELATGVLVEQVDGQPVEPKVVYNMYGIGAHDIAPKRLGSEYAYKQGWFTPEEAIIGGAKWKMLTMYELIFA